MQKAKSPEFRIFQVRIAINANLSLAIAQHLPHLVTSLQMLASTQVQLLWVSLFLLHVSRDGTECNLFKLSFNLFESNLLPAIHQRDVCHCRRRACVCLKYF